MRTIHPCVYFVLASAVEGVEKSHKGVFYSLSGVFMDFTWWYSTTTIVIIGKEFTTATADDSCASTG